MWDWSQWDKKYISIPSGWGEIYLKETPACEYVCGVGENRKVIAKFDAAPVPYAPEQYLDGAMRRKNLVIYW